MKIYKGNILFTKQPDRFETLQHGYIAVENGCVKALYDHLPDNAKEAEIIDYGDKLIIPAMNDLHVHAPQDPYCGIGARVHANRSWPE